jgi:hypothetical protein
VRSAARTGVDEGEPMTLVERIASMTDADLASLHVNAVRLSAGDGARKREAADLLPALEAEIGARKVRVADAKVPGKSKRRKSLA